MASITIAHWEFDLVGPGVDDDVRRTISRYGADAVREAVKRRTKKAPGRKLDDDHLSLRPILDEDATVWLDGGDPFAARTNYAIAKEYCAKIPGISADSNFDRLKRKLAKNRRFWVFERAFALSRQGHPYTQHLRAIEALIECSSQTFWANFLESGKALLADYQAKVGQAPPDEMDMSEVEYVATHPIRGIGLLRHSDLASGMPDP